MIHGGDGLMGWWDKFGYWAGSAESRFSALGKETLCAESKALGRANLSQN
jgi:hypothetical protein